MTVATAPVRLTPAGEAVRESEGRTASPAVIAAGQRGARIPRQTPPPPDALRVPTADAVLVAFQPIVGLPAMQLTGVEALARFPAPPTAPPHLWFARAEWAGTARDLEIGVVTRALARWVARPVGDYVAVNVSTRTLVDPALLTVLLDADAPYGGVVVEVTEHARVDDDDEARDAIGRLRAAGARVALDDVGAGFASPDLVRRLRPDIVKIDGGVVAGLRGDAADRLVAAATIEATVEAAREVGATVAAEGVETPDDLRAVRAFGVDEAQGYLFGRPSSHRALCRRWGAVRLPAARPATP